MNIRIAAADDAKQLAEIYAYYVENFSYSFEYEAPSADEFSKRITETLQFFPFFVCEENNEILGFAYARKHKERKAYQWVCETSIYVKYGLNKKGIGTALYNELLPMLKKQGFVKAFAVLGCPNEGSEIFHKKMGFTFLATLPDMGYKFDCWHDIKYYALYLNAMTDNMKVPIAYNEVNFNIRLAVPADAPDVANVLIHSWEVAYKDIVPAEYIKEKNATRQAQFQKNITHENTTYYVMQKNEKTVGMMRLKTVDSDDSVFDMEAIYLHPDYFRQGIGTAAMEFAFEKARNLGKTVMTVWVLEENINAIEFYKKHGFAADGGTRIWNYGKPLNGIRMRRDL